MEENNKNEVKEPVQEEVSGQVDTTLVKQSNIKPIEGDPICINDFRYKGVHYKKDSKFTVKDKTVLNELKAEGVIKKLVIPKTKFQAEFEKLKKGIHYISTCNLRYCGKEYPRDEFVPVAKPDVELMIQQGVIQEVKKDV